MTDPRPVPAWGRVALWFGFAVPVLYYGLQAAAAPSFPGFSILGTTASELGSDLSSSPDIFNTGIIVLAGVTFIAAAGFGVTLWHLRANPVVVAVVVLVIAICGVQSLWAGMYPLPDPRHGGHPGFIAGMLLLPVALTVATWKRTPSRLGRAYWIATLVLLAAMVPVMSGALGWDTHAYRGLLQRTFALAVFPPIAVAAYQLGRAAPRPAG